MSYLTPKNYCMACDASHIGVSCKQYAELTRCKAVEVVELPVSNLKIKVAGGDVWLTFFSKSGKTGTIHVGNLINGGAFPGNVTQAISDWVGDRKEEARGET